MNDAFQGIFQKLQRSYENIGNLDVEIQRFLKQGNYPVLSNDNEKLIPEAIEYHRNRIVPLRFSVLAGEIVHQLRSCFDHVVWLFSESGYRAKHVQRIGFPILETRPTKEDWPTKYERKIKGISNAKVLNLIEQLQPYNRAVPGDSLLLIIHNLDIIDKHRTLVIVASTGALEFPIDLLDRYIRNQSGIPGSLPVDIASEFKRHGKIIPQVAFSEFCKGESETVVQGLGEIHNYVTGLMKQFDALS